MRLKLARPFRHWPNPIQSTLLALTLAASIGGTVLALTTSKDLDKQITEAKETARPAKVIIVKITAKDCADCFDIESALGVFKNQSVTVREERSYDQTSPEGKALISEFKISRVPTFLVQGEVESAKLSQYFGDNGQIVGDTFVFTKTQPLFIDPSTGEKNGLLIASVITAPAKCKLCFDPSTFVPQLKSAGLKITEEKKIDPLSDEGKSLIEKYRLSALPSLIISDDAKYYDLLVAARSGTIESDGSFVLRSIEPPYYDLGKKRIVGEVELIFLKDKTCADCYDTGSHKRILEQGYGVAIASERALDVSSPEAKRLIDKYDIGLIPTVLLSPEADAYASLKAVWPQVGTVGSDGWYIFRSVDELGPVIYKDLKTGQVIRPATASSTTSSTPDVLE